MVYVPLFIAQCLTCNCKLFEKQRPRIRHPSNLLVETPMKDNTEEAERRLEEVFRLWHRSDRRLVKGERGRKGDWVRKSLRPQCSSEQVLARLRWGSLSASLEKGHIGQRWPRSRTPRSSDRGRKWFLEGWIPQWIKRHSMCDCHPPRSPGSFPGEGWVVDFWGPPHQFIDICWQMKQ